MSHGFATRIAFDQDRPIVEAAELWINLGDAT